MVDLNKEREVVHNAINTLFDIAKVQKAEIDLLNVDISNKKLEIDSLKSENENIQQNYSAMSDKQSDWLDEIQDLYADNTRMSDEIDSLKAENVRLKEQLVKVESGEYVVVPVIANKKMLKAGYDAHDEFFFDSQVHEVYKAMIEASKD